MSSFAQLDQHDGEMNERRSLFQRALTYACLTPYQADTMLKVIKIGKLLSSAVFCLFYGIAIWTFTDMFLSGHAIAKPEMAALIMGFVTLFFPTMTYLLH
jgi:hypothetical protein